MEEVTVKDIFRFTPLKKDTHLTGETLSSLFTKIAQDNRISKIADLEAKVQSTFGDKLNVHLTSWLNKLALDKERLKDVFKG